MKYKSLKVDIKTPLEKQLKKLGVVNYLDLSQFAHSHQENEIFDVEDGSEMLGKSPNECMEKFFKSDRRGLTIYEGLALLRKNPKVFGSHFIDLCGSRRGGGDVAHWWLSGGRPELGWSWASGSGAEWGSASCGSSLKLEPRNLETLESRVLKLEKFAEKVEKVLKI